MSQIPHESLPAVSEKAPDVGPSAVVKYDPFKTGQLLYTNLPANHHGTTRLLMLATGGKLPSISDKLGEVLNLSAYVVHPVTLYNEQTGEVTDTNRMVLIMNDGTMISCVSSTAIKAIGKLIESEGNGPWEPPIKIKWRQEMTKPPKRIFILEIVDESPIQLPWKTYPTPRKGGK